MLTLLRPVRFEDVDAASIVFFARYAGYGHEAMEHLFDTEVDGGYAALITQRRIGFPAVKLVCEYHAPLRYGEVCAIDTFVSRLGTRSADLRYEMRAQKRDDPSASGTRCATLVHTVVVSDLAKMASIKMPNDVRAALQAHVGSGDDALS